MSNFNAGLVDVVQGWFEAIEANDKLGATQK